MFEGEFEVFPGDQAFIEVGLPFGEDCGLVLGHAGPGQALDKGMSVEGDGLCFHKTQDNGRGGGLQAGVAQGRYGDCLRAAMPAGAGLSFISPWITVFACSRPA